jgi:hypothetical protein
LTFGIFVLFIHVILGLFVFLFFCMGLAYWGFSFQFSALGGTVLLFIVAMGTAFFFRSSLLIFRFFPFLPFSIPVSRLTYSGYALIGFPSVFIRGIEGWRDGYHIITGIK